MNILILFVLLMTTSFNTSIMHGQVAAAEEQISTTDVLRMVSPQLIAGDIFKTAQAIKKLPFEKQKEVLEAIISNNKSPLNRNQKLNLIFKIALKKPNEREQNEILKMLLQYPDLLEGKSPLLYRAVLDGNEKVVPAILTAFENENEAIILKSLQYAIQMNNLKALQAMFANGVKITQETAGDLLWQAVEQNKKIEFINLLKKYGANVNAPKKGRTPLIKAAENNNLAQVKELVQAGADVNQIVDNAVGSALQVAVRKGFTDIDLFLRKKGARE